MITNNRRQATTRQRWVRHDDVSSQVWQIVIRIGGGLLLVSLLATVGFVTYKSVAFFHHYGFIKFFGSKWNPKGASYGISDLVINTLFVLLVSLAIAVPLMVFTAVFVNEFMTRFWKQRVKSLIRILAGIPSVVFGLFGLSVLGPILQRVHPGGQEGVAPTSFVLTCVIMAFMGLPIMLALTIDALASVPNRLRASAAALGVNKTTYSLLMLRLVWLRVVGAALLGLARIIGETMAVLMIAGNNPDRLNIHGGLVQFLYSQVATLASLIGFEILESTQPLQSSGLYAVGLLLFVLVLLINLLVLAASKLSRWWKRHRHSVLLRPKKAVATTHLVTIHNHMRAQIDQPRLASRVSQVVVLSFLVSSTVLVLGFIGLIAMTIIVRGLLLMNPTDFTSTDPHIGIQASFLVSLLLVFLTIVIAVPIALLITVLLTEYTRRRSWIAQTVGYCLNVLTSTPSIVYGLFGLYFFIFLLHMSLSVVTGALTLSFLLLPMLIRNFQEAFWSVPNRLRAASLALGATKIKTTGRVVLVESLPAMVTAVLLAAGRAIGESAPIYLTLGTTVVLPTAGFLSPGAAMSTQILALWRIGGTKSAPDVMYELSFLIMLLVWVFSGLGTLLANQWGSLRTGSSLSLQSFRQFCQRARMALQVKMQRGQHQAVVSKGARG